MLGLLTPFRLRLYLNDDRPRIACRLSDGVLAKHSGCACSRQKHVAALHVVVRELVVLKFKAQVHHSDGARIRDEKPLDPLSEQIGILA